MMAFENSAGSLATPYGARFQQNVVPPTPMDIGTTKQSRSRVRGDTRKLGIYQP
jgi:hypothetical protein